MNPRALCNRGVQLYRESSKGDKNHYLSFLYVRKAAEKRDGRAIIELICMRDKD
jgi:hypothetical protein